MEEKITAIKNEVAQQFQSRAALRSPPHITLQMPFRMSSSQITKLHHQLERFCQNQSAFPLELQDYGCFPTKVIFIEVVPSKDLAILQKELSRMLQVQMNIFNSTYGDRPFHPHVTVAFRDLRKPKFYTAWDYFRKNKFHGQLLVERLTLLIHNGKMWLPQHHYRFGKNCTKIK